MKKQIERVKKNCSKSSAEVDWDKIDRVIRRIGTALKQHNFFQLISVPLTHPSPIHVHHLSRLTSCYSSFSPSSYRHKHWFTLCHWLSSVPLLPSLCRPLLLSRGAQLLSSLWGNMLFHRVTKGWLIRCSRPERNWHRKLFDERNWQRKKREDTKEERKKSRVS